MDVPMNAMHFKCIEALHYLNIYKKNPVDLNMFKGYKIDLITLYIY